MLVGGKLPLHQHQEILYFLIMFFFSLALYACNYRYSERVTGKLGGEGMTCSKGPQAGFEPRAAAVRTKTSMVRALPGDPPRRPPNNVSMKVHVQAEDNWPQDGTLRCSMSDRGRGGKLTCNY